MQYHGDNPVTQPLPLVEELVPAAWALARREAHCPADVEDLVQVALFAYHRARQRPRSAGVRAPRQWARTVMQRATRAYYYQQHEWRGRGERDRWESLDADGGEARVVARAPDPLAQVCWEDFFVRVERCGGPVARAVAENLVSPAGECAEYILAEVRGKASAQAAAVPGVRRPRGVKRRIRLTSRMVREALGLTAQEWEAAVQVVRACARAWCAV